jgi:hypothetical protein
VFILVLLTLKIKKLVLDAEIGCYQYKYNFTKLKSLAASENYAGSSWLRNEDT